MTERHNKRRIVTSGELSDSFEVHRETDEWYRGTTALGTVLPLWLPILPEGLNAAIAAVPDRQSETIPESTESALSIILHHRSNGTLSPSEFAEATGTLDLDGAYELLSHVRKSSRSDPEPDSQPKFTP